MSSPKKTWVIRHDGAGFYMLDPLNTVVWSLELTPQKPQRPRKMAAHAWEHGADEVKHDYDLRLDPDN